MNPRTRATTELPPPTPLRPHPERRPRWITRIAMLIAGLAVGLGAAEAAFYYRDDGAFPHLNLYVADAELGVRLLPGATETISFGGNPITHVRINRDGYRGDELPAPGAGDVLVVGDSQVFGLGVEDDQTFAAVLGKTLGTPVMNGGVPTYGPAEYRAVIAEQLARRHPRTVILTINLVNDLFEAQHPNRDRHAVWDGWAVRKETAPESITEFPGRELLYRRSHLVFAYRKWRYGDDNAEARSDGINERGVASEGTWRDIVTTGEQVAQQRAGLDAARHKRLEDVSWVHHEIASKEREIDRLISDVLHDREGADSRTIAVARANPGDIVYENTGGEVSRRVLITAEHISAAAAIRARLRTQLAEWAKTHTTGEARQTLAALDARDQVLAKLSELDVQKLQTALEPPLGAYLRDVQQLVTGAGARLVVVILPIDVQVSAEEWKKYGVPPIDMEPSKALTAELALLCRSTGVSVLDATPVLAQAEPGAFLDKDIHMTPKGHAAVAAALARTLREPPPVPGLARERSPVPMPDAFQQAQELPVRGASEAGCETKQVREWLRVRCTRTRTARPPAITSVGNIVQTTVPIGVDLERDDGHETLALVMPGAVSLVIPIVAGRELAANIRWIDWTRVLRVQWPSGQPAPAIRFDEPVTVAGPERERAPRTPPDGFDEPVEVVGRERERALRTPPDGFRSPVERAICDCWQTVFPSELTQDTSCAGAYGAADETCVQRYYQPTRRCPELLACIRREP